ncbi:hypothetical protein WA026_022904 [Henosepilachna vigintioctopunctata]|uniref:Uncharacterized protein n=1 Tax=Henosepilachna vigintioctopunctata TaxID=420089 RepID=A0AAW1TPP8_9CUCU
MPSNDDDDSSGPEEEENNESEQFTMSDIMRQLQKNHENMNDQMKQVRMDVKSIQEFIEFMSDRFDELQKENKMMLKLLKEEKQERKKASEKIEKLEERVMRHEKEKCNKNLIINNVPFKKEEKTEEIVTMIIQQLRMNIDTKKLMCKRLSTKEKAPILIELPNKDIRDLIMEKRKERGVMKLRHCGLPGDDNIFFNEDLPREK